MKFSKIIAAGIVAVATLMSVTPYAVAGPGPGHAGKQQETVGRQGNPANVDRIIKIKLYDNRFEPSTIKVRDGETIRFVVTNEGDAVHEFNIGRPSDHAGHQKEMMKMMDNGFLEFDRINDKMMKSGGMMHSDPNSVLLEPGKSANLIWNFNKTKRAEIACNVPGHYESGMIAKIIFQGAMD